MSLDLGQRIEKRTLEFVDPHKLVPPNERTPQKGMETLLQVATPLITAQGWQAVFDQALDTSLVMLHAALMSIQLIFRTSTL